MSWKDTIKDFREEPSGNKAPLKSSSSMRSPKKLKKLCNKLKNLWRSVPGMSLAELISECFTDEEMLMDFNKLSDDELFKRLEARYWKG